MEPFETTTPLTSVSGGAVQVLYGAATGHYLGGGGVTREGNQLWHQDTPGIYDSDEQSDLFGRSLATTGTSTATAP